MQSELAPYTLVEDAQGMESFGKQNEGITWMCFDTEFIGEKRFVTLICLIQVATEHGYYLIDPLKLTDLTPLLNMLTDEKIIKVVHAGDNDYRLFNTHFGIVPRNTFDTQIASAFLGYKYPVAFAKLVESELKILLSKGYTVTDWQVRPFRTKQLHYALDDVKHLYDLWQKLERKLKKLNRLEWVMEEMAILEDQDSYDQDPHKEAINSNLIKSLKKKEQIFLLRLLHWRSQIAEQRNHSKEMVLPSKYISPIVRAIHSGIDALKHNRRIPDNLVRQHGEDLDDMFKRPATQHELEVLDRIPSDNSDNPRQDILMEMLDLLVRYKCHEEGISHHMALPRGVLKRMKNDREFFDPTIAEGWRRAFLGEEIVSWFQYRRNLSIKFDDGKFELKMEDVEQDVEVEVGEG